jgi:hypothetical protein
MGDAVTILVVDLRPLYYFLYFVALKKVEKLDLECASLYPPSSSRFERVFV